jgi:hypothetical protein
MTTAELIRGVRDHAARNYNTDGWDFLVECWDDQDIGAQIAESDTLPRAIAACKRVLKTMDENRREIMATGEW